MSAAASLLAAISPRRCGGLEGRPLVARKARS